MYIDSVRVNMSLCRSAPCMYTAVGCAFSCAVCTRIASKSTEQGVDYCMGRDLDTT